MLIIFDIINIGAPYGRQEVVGITLSLREHRQGITFDTLQLSKPYIFMAKMSCSQIICKRFQISL